eukprot:2353393-Pyramimonas_sp.AAC.2
MARHVDGVLSGGLIWPPVSFHHSQEVQGDSLPLMAALGKYLGSLALPWVIGCDANVNPATSGLFEWCHKLGACVISPGKKDVRRGIWTGV